MFLHRCLPVLNLYRAMKGLVPDFYPNVESCACFFIRSGNPRVSLGPNDFFDVSHMLSAHARSWRKSQKGFSFVEVIISLFVFSIGFVGVASLATTTLRNSFLQRDSVVASLLVQEGMELSYNVRDTNIARGNEPFLNMPTGSYRVDYSNPSFSASCSTFDECQLSFLPVGSNNFFGYGASGSSTRFSRKVIVEDTSSGGVQKRRITSVVAWGGSAFPTSIDATHCAKSVSDASGLPVHCAFSQAELLEN